MNRESLIKALWPNTVVEEANLNVHISALRKALAENQGEHRYIETLPRLGYRFIAPVTEVNESEGTPPEPIPLTSYPASSIATASPTNLAPKANSASLSIPTSMASLAMLESVTAPLSQAENGLIHLIPATPSVPTPAAAKLDWINWRR